MMNMSAVMGACIGVRMDAAAGVLGAATIEAIEEQLPMAEKFARVHRFPLPLPDANEPREVVEQYREETVPQFRNEMRGIFAKELDRMFVGRVTFGEMEKYGLMDANMPDVMMAGLVTFNQAFCVLNKAGRIIDVAIEGMPAALPENNTYFSGNRILARAFFDGIVFGAGLLCGAEPLTMLKLMVGAVPTIEVLSYLAGSSGRSDRLARNEERAQRLKELSVLKGRVTRERTKLINLDERPIVTELDRSSPRMRSAMLNFKVEHKPGSVYIAHDFPYLSRFVDKKMKYAVVLLPNENGFEVRVTDEGIVHSSLVLGGERVVGAGYMLHRIEEGGSARLYLDGMSTTWPTEEDGIENTMPEVELADAVGLAEVKRAFEGLEGFSGSVETVKNVNAL